MTRLAGLQAFLAEAVRRPSPLAGAAAGEAAAIAGAGGRLSGAEQVDVYREQFWARHVDALREDFSALEAATGREAFGGLVRDYLAAHPPSSFTLRDLGARLADFLDARGNDPFLADLARVEWAFVEAFDAADAAPFDRASIAGVPEDAWPRARLALDPSLRRLSLGRPAHLYRDGAREARPEPRACRVVVFRGAEQIHAQEVPAAAGALLDALAEGAALGDACEHAAGASSTEPAALLREVAPWFADWTALGWIRAVVFVSQREGLQG